MLKIQKVEEPPFFSDFKKKSKPKIWDDFKPIRRSLRKHILEKEQMISGITLCTYCERRISLNDSQIDHVKPKDTRKFPKLFDKYSNLTVSCKCPSSCGQTKDNDYDDHFINPIEENPAEFMTYEAMTGKIVAIAPAKQERVERTCDILKLNSCHELLGARKRILVELFRSKDRAVEFIDTYPDFPTLIDFYRRNFLS